MLTNPYFLGLTELTWHKGKFRCGGLPPPPFPSTLSPRAEAKAAGVLKVAWALVRIPQDSKSYSAARGPASERDLKSPISLLRPVLSEMVVRQPRTAAAR